ncbi:MAG TPA: histidine kinase [Nocardioidaceae bacterium]|nr:histidine kinase [Nocardioidaceae bacterium]
MARFRGRGVVGLLLVLVVGAVVMVAVYDRRLRSAGRADLTLFGWVDVPYIGCLVIAVVVGALLAVRRPEHPVGWLFLALGLAMSGGGALDAYARYGVEARPGSLPLAEAAAVVSGGLFVVWFVLLALILHLTPTGEPLPGLWRTAATGTAWVGGLSYVTHLLWPIELDPPFQDLTAWELPGAGSGVTEVVIGGLVALTALGLVLAAVSLLVRFRRSSGTERRQLLWLVTGVVPLPAFVALAFYASPDHPVLLAVAVAGFVGLIPVAAGLSILQYHLYDVDQILSRAVTYLLVSALLALTFLTVAGVAGHGLGGRLGDSSVPAVLATLAAVAVAIPAYQGIQEAIDRRFRRRRYDALRQVRAFAADPGESSLEEVLRRALDAASLEVAYAVDDEWVDASGQRAAPQEGDVVVTRQGRVVARVRYDDAVDPELAGAVLDVATAELENAMLRARVARQLAEVRESRARIAAAHVSERRRLERNLHDGAQQRLLALALQLSAAQVNGSPDRMSTALREGIGELQAAVAELRELANGLHPAVLGEHGLRAALESLGARFPVTLDLDGVDQRFAPEVEEATWFVACEAVTNAVKHARATSIQLRLRRTDDSLTVEVSDDGAGGADAGGSGLRGIADRLEALGGSLVVATGASGTSVKGVLPCAS